MFSTTKYYFDIIRNFHFKICFTYGGYHCREQEEVAGDKSEVLLDELIVPSFNVKLRS
jgi:phosphatidylglycerophosphatase A